MSDDLRAAARAYLAHDGSGIGRHDEWAGDFDAMDLAVARDRLRAALATPEPVPESVPELEAAWEALSAALYASTRYTTYAEALAREYAALRDKP